MATHRIGGIGLSEAGPSTHHHHHNHHVPYGSLLQGINTPASTLVNQGAAFNFGELEEAIVLQGVNSRHDEGKASLFTGKPAATLEMFPSWPMRFQQTTPIRGGSKSGGESTDSALSTKTEPPFEAESPMSSSKKAASSSDNHNHHGHQAFEFDQQQPTQQLQHDMMMMANGHDHASRTGPSQNQSSPPKSPQEKRKGAGSTSDKPLDAKTLRRLAQNREAARKSRLRKKAYVQQLESSRLKLTQLEQDLQRARSQGLLMDCGGVGGNLSPGAAMFDMEYARWLEEDQRMVEELRSGLQAPLSDSEMRVIVDAYLSHYDDLFRIKAVAAKSDVFHLINGMWSSKAERCFRWIGGFKPSELITMLVQQLEPLAEQQIMGMYGLRHSSNQAEDALTQGLDQLQQSLVDTISGGPIVDGVQQMVVAMGKLANLEGFVRQADNLRQQSLHHLCRLLTVRQAARCFLVIGEYYGRLRALSSLWASRQQRETLVNDDNSCQTSSELQMVQSSQNNHNFPSF